ncbi:MAG TPA: aminoglycoside phosphotransferase family protein [Chloroflexia bacterium]|nr:aminoglycoside phosphotransferase family protein [Chloroflexia bacterium]
MQDDYRQPDAPDPVLDESTVLALVREAVPAAQAVTRVDESGGEARVYVIDDQVILKVQRPPRVRPRTSLEKEAFFLRQLAEDAAIPVPRVLGYGQAGGSVEYLCLTRLPGVAFAHAPLAPATRHAVLVSLGETLRRVHQRCQAPLVACGLFPGDTSAADLRARLAGYFAFGVQRIHDRAVAWPLACPPEEVAACALAALPATDERVALHANPGEEHVFVDPAAGRFAGLIDFGDAYRSHPALDLWAWWRPADRAAVLAGYTAAAPVSAAFLATWQVILVLRVLIALGARPAPDATPADLQVLLAAL